jgi:hypothetical protein
MMQDRERERDHGGFIVLNALITLLVCWFVFAAFDDITTDNATDFTFEYKVLLVCTIWLAFLAAWLIWRRHVTLGALSLAALAAGLWGQRAIGPGITPGFWPGYLLTTGALLWFLVLSLILLALGCRAVLKGAPPYQAADEP